VHYRPTLDGIYSPYSKEVKPTSNGTFKIEFENEGLGVTTLSYKGTLYRLLHDTNSTISVEIKDVNEQPKSVSMQRYFVYKDSLKQTYKTKFSGDFEAINNFYNRNLRTSYSTTQIVDGHYYSNLIFQASSTASALAIFDSLIQVEVKQINQLPQLMNAENPAVALKESEIRNFLINEVRTFYSGVFLNAMFLKRRSHNIKVLTDTINKADDYNRDWEILIEKLYEQAKTSIKPSPNSPDYLEFMESMAYTLSEYKNYQFTQQTTNLDEMVVNRLLKYDTALFHDGKTRLAYELSGMQQFLNDQLYYSPGLLHAVYDVLEKNPTSIHLDFYKNNIDKLKNSLAVAQGEFKDAKFIRGNIDSFVELINRFVGKPLLIDIWATWCFPCIEDFKHKEVIQPLLDSKSIEVLFISLDKKEWEDRWKQSVKLNELRGHHIRADQTLKDSMWETIGGEIGVIPRYVLVDRDGKIVYYTAARPSSPNLLREQLESILN
jgi:thiol-disulfide isomerase/thioredoxin